MKLISTVSHAAIYSLLFLTLIILDSALSERGSLATVLIEHGDRERDEIDGNLSQQTPVNVDEAVIDSLYADYAVGRSPLVQQVYKVASLGEKAVMLKAFGKRLMADGRYADLIKLMAELPENERFPDTLFQLALSLSRTEQPDEAIKVYRELLEVQPGRQSAAINLGLLLNRQKRYELATTVLTRAVEISSGHRKAKALSALGSAEKNLGNWQDAEQRYRESIEYRPAHTLTWLKLASVQQKLAFPYPVVAKTLHRAASLQPDHADAWHTLGRYQLERLDFHAARESLEKALALSGTHAQIRQDYAWALTELDLRDQAVQQWQWLSKHAATAADQLLAEHFVSQFTQRDLALQAIPQMRDEMKYAQILLADEFGTTANESPTLQDDSAWAARYWLREARDRDIAESVEAYEHLLAQNLAIEQVLWQRSQALAAVGRIDEALADLDRALLKAPQKPQLIGAKLELLNNSGQWVRARQFLLQVPESIRNLPAVRNQINQLRKPTVSQHHRRQVVAIARFNQDSL